jgi:hypothetical protein
VFDGLSDLFDVLQITLLFKDNQISLHVGREIAAPKFSIRRQIIITIIISGFVDLYITRFDSIFRVPHHSRRVLFVSVIR